MNAPSSVIVSESSSFIPKEFEFVKEASSGEWSIVLQVKNDNSFSTTITMRRLNLFSWWPARQIQLFFVRKAFNK